MNPDWNPSAIIAFFDRTRIAIINQPLISRVLSQLSSHFWVRNVTKFCLEDAHDYGLLIYFALVCIRDRLFNLYDNIA